MCCTRPGRTSCVPCCMAPAQRLLPATWTANVYILGALFWELAPALPREHVNPHVRWYLQLDPDQDRLRPASSRSSVRDSPCVIARRWLGCTGGWISATAALVAKPEPPRKAEDIFEEEAGDRGSKGLSNTIVGPHQKRWGLAVLHVFLNFARSWIRGREYHYTCRTIQAILQHYPCRNTVGVSTEQEWQHKSNIR